MDFLASNPNIDLGLSRLFYLFYLHIHRTSSQAWMSIKNVEGLASPSVSLRLYFPSLVPMGPSLPINLLARPVRNRQRRRSRLLLGRCGGVNDALQCRMGHTCRCLQTVDAFCIIAMRVLDQGPDQCADPITNHCSPFWCALCPFTSNCVPLWTFFKVAGSTMSRQLYTHTKEINNKKHWYHRNRLSTLIGAPWYCVKGFVIVEEGSSGELWNKDQSKTSFLNPPEVSLRKMGATVMQYI